eukprot:7396420-Karenia_brevis.AAC.1
MSALGFLGFIQYTLNKPSQKPEWLTTVIKGLGALLHHVPADHKSSLLWVAGVRLNFTGIALDSNDPFTAFITSLPETRRRSDVNLQKHCGQFRHHAWDGWDAL